MNTLQDITEKALAEMEAWYNRALGQYLLVVEREGLKEVLPRLFGYHLLQVGGPRWHHLVHSSPIAHRVYVAMTADPKYPGLWYFGLSLITVDSAAAL